MSAALTAPCSACGAAPGAPCTSTEPGHRFGGPVAGVHAPRAIRYRNALRALHPAVGVARGLR